MLRVLIAHKSTGCRRPLLGYSSVRTLSAKISSASVSSEEQEAARTWFDRFAVQGISRKSCEVTFSRSSGPGGQNVNKTNSKATLRLRLSNLSPKPPKFIYEQLCNSRYSAEKGQSLILQADSSRSQADNKEECFSRLNSLIKDICGEVIVKEASPEQQARVKRLQKQDNERRLSVKKQQSLKKSSRKAKFSD